MGNLVLSVSEKASHRIQTEVSRGITRTAKVATYMKFIRRPGTPCEVLILVDMRKTVMIVILRELGVKREWQERLATAKIFRPKSEYE